MSGQHAGSGDHESEAYDSSHEHLPDSDSDVPWFTEVPPHNEDEDDDDDDGDEYGLENEDEDEDGDEGAEDEDEDDEDQFLDAEGGEVELELIIQEVTDDGNTDNQTTTGAQADAAQQSLQQRILRIIGNGRTGPGYLTSRQLLALLRGQDLNRVIFDEEDDEEEDVWRSTRRRRNPDPNRFPKVPSEEGQKLMASGLFGAFDKREPDYKRLARRILDRELGLRDRSGRKTHQGLMAQHMIPSTKPEMVIHYDDPVCCGQFSDDGNFFYACVKDFRVRMYDTSNPYSWRHYKTVTYPFGQWTLTDADLSPDNKWLAYTSLQSSVCFAPTDPDDTGDPYALNLAGPSQRGSRQGGAFAIFSVRFSGDGRLLVAGTGAESIVVYDIERRQPIHHVAGHHNDVNAVCFADKLSPHILYSGSDDCTIKVWDTRSIGDSREAGAFVGHLQGLTYIDSKDDGRYILSNGKDQTMKLWDLRMAMTTARYEQLDPTRITRPHEYDYDYRWQEYDDRQWFKHPHDNSLVTFRGHKVQRTLIRCHFSPPGSTNSRYVYSGSQDGFVYVWNLDATLAAKIDVKSTTRGLRPSPDRRYRVHQSRGTEESWLTLVRDAAWHPNAPLLVASSWDGPTMGAGTATLHSFNENDVDESDAGMGVSLNEKLVAEETPQESSRASRW
ncbi:WD40-repeat-containing domain protein [Podospora didyma]|uniref:WD40-repeat-containing domain protein n=1 Tax=Podospora didyma TaxID=330526 RepID=A0AAE0P676_9PEZI|nr:WD40-repeat-containing domain protein [Podospora didyma]